MTEGSVMDLDLTIHISRDLVHQEARHLQAQIVTDINQSISRPRYRYAPGELGQR
jgi:hypothetical protein